MSAILDLVETRRDAPADRAPDPGRMLRRAEEMVAAGRPGAGRPLLDALDRIGAEPVAVADLRARLALHEERLTEAASGLDAAIAAWPGQALLHRRRAEVRGRLEQYGEAARDAAEAVFLDPADAAARAMLGLLLLLLGHAGEARACLADAVFREPAHPAFRQALADALEQEGAPALAVRTMAEGIALAPRAPSLRSGLARLQARGGDWAGVVATAEAARRDGAADAALFGLHGHALSALRRGAEAADAFAEALKLAPEDACLRHLVASAGGIPCGGRAPAAYLRAVFDDCAAEFEARAIEAGDRVPGLIRAAVEADAPLAQGPALDLGCGTGLIGVALHDLDVGWLVGVDVSPRMIAQVSPRGLYDEMHVAEITDFLAAETRRFPLIVAGDSLCYFGPLELVLSLARARMPDAGLLVFSLEAGPDEGWRLEPTGRYAHAPAYVAAEAARAGLDVVSITPEALRFEQGRAVDGLIVTLARRDDVG